MDPNNAVDVRKRKQVNKWMLGTEGKKTAGICIDHAEKFSENDCLEKVKNTRNNLTKNVGAATLVIDQMRQKEMRGWGRTWTKI